MSSTRPPLGGCPHCGTEIPDYRLLIEYEINEGVGIFAECPTCREVVSPI